MVTVKESEAGAARLNARSGLISVVIPHLNDRRRLKRCLELLERQTLPRERFEIIVADNGSDYSPGVLSADVAAHAKLVLASDRGAGPARNAGVAAAQGEIIAFTDADCEPAEDWLERGVEALERGDFVGGSVTVTVADPDRPTPAEAYELVFGFRIDRYARALGFVSSCNLFVRADTFAAVGGFGNGFSEDVEWCWRAGDRGFSLVYDPRVVIRHPARRDWGALVVKHDRLVRESYLLSLNQGVARWRWRLRAIAVGLSPGIHFWRALTSSRLESVRSRLAVVAVLFRLRIHRSRMMWRQLRRGSTR